jgi:hypothetical protein
MNFTFTLWVLNITLIYDIPKGPRSSTKNDLDSGIPAVGEKILNYEWLGGLDLNGLM